VAWKLKETVVKIGVQGNFSVNEGSVMPIGGCFLSTVVSS